MPFKKGQSGNPGGRPKEASEVKRLAQEKGADAIAKLVEILSCGEARTELAAAQALLDRGYGKPSQSVDMTVTQTSHEDALDALEYGSDSPEHHATH